MAKKIPDQDQGLDLARALGREYARQAGVNIEKIAKSRQITSVGGIGRRASRNRSAVLSQRLVKKLVSG